MINKNYEKALSEVRIILKKTDENLLYRIPQNFLNFIENNCDTKHKVPSIDINRKLEEQGFLDETLTILSLIYRNYWCNEQQRKEYDEIAKKNEQKLQEKIREKYSPDKIFEEKESQKERIERNVELQQALVEYKVSIFEKICLKLKSFFMKK